MTAKMTAAVVTAAVWLAAALAVLGITAKAGVIWDVKAGYLLAGAVVLAGFTATELLLTRLRLDPPYGPR